MKTEPETLTQTGPEQLASGNPGAEPRTCDGGTAAVELVVMATKRTADNGLDLRSQREPNEVIGG